MITAKRLLGLGSPASISALRTLAARSSVPQVFLRLLSSAGAPKPFQDIPKPKGYPLIGTAHINEMTYLRNVLKETQRHYPLVGFNQRVLQNDTVLCGYLVPKGTEILMPQIIIGQMPELYSEPDKFLPERWDKENKDKLPSMFAQLPFGFGPRMCIGRRVAELELHIALTHLIREYRVEYLDKEPMGFVFRFLLKPERPLNLTFNKC